MELIANGSFIRIGPAMAKCQIYIVLYAVCILSQHGLSRCETPDPCLCNVNAMLDGININLEYRIIINYLVCNLQLLLSGPHVA